MVTIPSACELAIQVRHACSLRASATRASDLERGYGRRMVPLQKSQYTDFKQLFDVRNWLKMVRNQEALCGGVVPYRRHQELDFHAGYQPYRRRGHVLVVNEREAAHLRALFALRDDASLKSLVPGLVIVTLAARGAIIFGNDRPVTVPSFSGSVLDVIGAGDAFLAGFLHAQLAGAPVHEAGLWAAAAAAVFIDDAERWPPLSPAAVEKRLDRYCSALPFVRDRHVGTLSAPDSTR